jgi:hypothetical protein
MSEEGYSKVSCSCRRLSGPNFPEDSAEIQVGDFIWGSEEGDGMRTLYIVLPGRDPNRLRPDAIHVRFGGSNGVRVWSWDGNLDKPTLAPSLHWTGDWHGHLENGYLKSC